MGKSLISGACADAIKAILLECELSKPIEIDSAVLDMHFYANQITQSAESSSFNEMQETFFLNDGSADVITIRGRNYEVFYNLGEWGYKTRLPASHICLGTNPIRFGSEYFAQLELSQALEDDECIYIVKNITKLAGQGAISRLNHGLGADKSKKRLRRQQLASKLETEIISYDQSDWLCLCRICKDDLLNTECHGDVLHNVLFSFLRYAFAVEELVALGD